MSARDYFFAFTRCRSWCILGRRCSTTSSYRWIRGRSWLIKPGCPLVIVIIGIHRQPKLTIWACVSSKTFSVLEKIWEIKLKLKTNNSHFFHAPARTKRPHLAPARPRLQEILRNINNEPNYVRDWQQKSIKILSLFIYFSLRSPNMTIIRTAMKNKITDFLSNSLTRANGPP